MHGRMENSNPVKAKVNHSPHKPASGLRLRIWFPWIVAALVNVIIPVSAYYIYEAAENGIVLWEPYPLFALFVALIFMANTRIYPDG